MRLRQNQVWQQGDEYIRIVRLERMRVEYKVMDDFATKEGKHREATKKEFCRLLKGAVLVSPEETEAVHTVQDEHEKIHRRADSPVAGSALARRR